MNSTAISATELKNKLADVLNAVYYNKTTTVVKKHGKPVAKIVPIHETVYRESLKKALDKSFGTLPDFPDVTKFRRSRKKTFSL